jgi:2-oxoglutarate ferredoxin oxidoreductase subunit gamma
MTEEIIIAGFGGQGVLSMGKILAYSELWKIRKLPGSLRTGPKCAVEQPTLP